VGTPPSADQVLSARAYSDFQLAAAEADADEARSGTMQVMDGRVDVRLEARVLEREQRSKHGRLQQLRIVGELLESSMLSGA
jgi:hypothetical protein